MVARTCSSLLASPNQPRDEVAISHSDERSEELSFFLELRSSTVLLGNRYRSCRVSGMKRTSDPVTGTGRGHAFTAAREGLRWNARPLYGAPR
jgi:hypothetical protein